MTPNNSNGFTTAASVTAYLGLFIKAPTPTLLKQITDALSAYLEARSVTPEVTVEVGTGKHTGPPHPHQRILDRANAEIAEEERKLLGKTPRWP